jgi:hypothetical protein
MDEVDDGPVWTIQGDKATITRGDNNNRLVFAIERGIASIPYKMLVTEKSGWQRKALVRVEGDRLHECIRGVGALDYPADFEAPDCVVNVYIRLR